MKETMYDENLILKDAGLVAADAAGTVDSEAKVIDLGSATALVEGKMIVDVTAIEIASNDEVYKISLQGSDNSDFSTGDEVDLAILELGALEVIGGDQDSTIGRYIVPFRNEKNGTTYRYVRIYTDVAGTIATGINFSAYLGK
jgi:hypothetical protein